MPRLCSYLFVPVLYHQIPTSGAPHGVLLELSKSSWYQYHESVHSVIRTSPRVPVARSMMNKGAAVCGLRMVVDRLLLARTHDIPELRLTLPGALRKSIYMVSGSDASFSRLSSFIVDLVMVFSSMVENPSNLHPRSRRRCSASLSLSLSAHTHSWSGPVLPQALTPKSSTLLPVHVERSMICQGKESSRN